MRSAHPDGSEKGGPDPNPTAPKKAASFFKNIKLASEFFYCVFIAFALKVVVKYAREAA